MFAMVYFAAIYTYNVEDKGAIKTFHGLVSFRGYDPKGVV